MGPKKGIEDYFDLYFFRALQLGKYKIEIALLDLEKLRLKILLCSFLLTHSLWIFKAKKTCFVFGTVGKTAVLRNRHRTGYFLGELERIGGGL